MNIFPELKYSRRHSGADERIIASTVGHAQAILSDMEALGYIAEDDEPATKALDYASICERVCHAVHEALEEAEELDEDGTGMGIAVKGPEASCEVYVYDDYAVACLDDKDIKIGYTLDDTGEVELDEPEDWALVTWDVEEIGDYEDSVKMLPDGRIGGYAVRFGSADEPDLSDMRDYFTKSTDFWLEAWATRPMLYHHAQDEATKAAPVVGTWTGASVDSVGVWLEGQLNKAHRYHAAIKELVQRGMLKLSSDSAPHLVVRERQPNGTNEIKRWPMLAASLTPTPAEPRLLPISHIKALYAEAGLLPPVEIDDSPEATDASEPVEMAPRAMKTGDDERARRLAMTLDLMMLEAA